MFRAKLTGSNAESARPSSNRESQMPESTRSTGFVLVHINVCIQTRAYIDMYVYVCMQVYVWKYVYRHSCMNYRWGPAIDLVLSSLQFSSILSIGLSIYLSMY